MASVPTESFAFRIDTSVMDEVRRIAVHSGVSNAAVVNICLRAGLKAHGHAMLAMTSLDRGGRG